MQYVDEMMLLSRCKFHPRVDQFDSPPRFLWNCTLLEKWCRHMQNDHKFRHASARFFIFLTLCKCFRWQLVDGLPPTRHAKSFRGPHGQVEQASIFALDLQKFKIEGKCSSTRHASFMQFLVYIVMLVELTSETNIDCLMVSCRIFCLHDGSTTYYFMCFLLFWRRSQNCFGMVEAMPGVILMQFSNEALNKNQVYSISYGSPGWEPGWKFTAWHVAYILEDLMDM